MDRTIFAAICILACAPVATADIVRHSTVPADLQGKWATSAAACAGPAFQQIVLAPDRIGECPIDSVSEEPTSEGVLYSALLRCPNSAGQGVPSVKALMLMPKDRSQMSAGSAFGHLQSYQLCPK